MSKIQSNPTPAQISSRRNTLAIAVIALIAVFFLLILSAIAVTGLHVAKALPQAVEGLLARLEPEKTIQNDQGAPLTAADTQEQQVPELNGFFEGGGTPELTDELINSYISGVNQNNIPPLESADVNADGVIGENEAPKPNEVDPQIEQTVSELERLLSKESLSSEEYDQVEKLFEQLQVLHAKKYASQ